MILPGRIETDRTGELDTANAKAQGKSRDEIAALRSTARLRRRPGSCCR
jgi:3-oxoacyl-[acyl-carrier protein] reductase